MTYTYNLSGALIEQKYPSGRVVKNVLDNDGDLSIVQSKKNQNAGYWNYAQHFTYTAAGAVSAVQLGNGTWESTAFNSRLQPTKIALGSVKDGDDKLHLGYGYGTTANNGNVLSQTITVPTVGTNTGFTAAQTYTYDSLNRIKDVKEHINNSQTPAWKQTFKYDRYGNRNFDEANTTTLPKHCTESSVPAVCAADRKVVNPEILTSNNRLKTDQDGDSQDDYLYDTSGNTTKDANGRTFVYDGENKQIQVKDSQNQIIGEYFYDGDGNRVKKYVPSTGETTIFIYDASGKMVAEYSTNVETTNAKVSYLTNDHLGSPRITTDRDGSVISRRDFLPFGEEIQSGTGGRTTAQGYGGQDSIRQKFTSYERDNESDLDFAQARMYNKNHGRFTSPDEPFMDQYEDNPQSWNLYLYVRNNPLNLVDPFGTKAGCPPGSPDGCYEREGKYYHKDENGNEIGYDPTPIIVETMIRGRRSGPRNQFDRAMQYLGDWLRHWFGRKTPPNQPAPPAAPSQPSGGNQPSQPNPVYGPPNPRYSLPSASQRLDNMNGLIRSQAQSQLQSNGFSLRSTTSGGNQQWRHSDGSTVWIMNNGRVVRTPTTSAAQQFGATGRKDGVRVDAATGQIMRTTQHHQSGTQEIVH
jgi:RHS repeat-associated protein